MDATTFPKATLAQVQASPLDAVVAAAAKKMLGLRMTNIRGNADAADADSLRADLEALWGILDPVILSIGEYAAHNLKSISAHDLARNWTDVLRSSLEGNATFNLETAAEKIAEDRAEYRADARGWDRARLEGVD